MKSMVDNQAKRLYSGEVISDKMEKTVVVKVERVYRHPAVGKVMRTYRKCAVHDPREVARVGDVIEFYEGRPVSKTKRMYLHRVISSRLI